MTVYNVIAKLRNMLEEYEGNIDFIHTPWYQHITRIMQETSDERTKLERKYIECIHLMARLVNMDAATNPEVVSHFVNLIDDWAMDNIDVMCTYTFAYGTDEEGKLKFNDTEFLEAFSKV